MDMRAWHYFLSLERDVAATAAYVEPATANFETYSDRFAGLLLLIGSEVDVVAKELCIQIDPQARRHDMGDCSKVILGRFSPLPSVEVSMVRYNLTLKPWAEWGASPPTKTNWWDDYNGIKHDRLAQRERGSQRSVLNALAGLMVLNLYLYREVPWPHPYPELLDCGFPEYLVEDATARRVPGI